MAMSEEEILSEAARIRASRRPRVAKTCARCGNAFTGITQAKYCSDACRMAAAREQRQQQPKDQIVKVHKMHDDESYRDYFVRIGGVLTPDNEATLAAMERIRARAQPFFNANGEIENSTDFIRRDRDERS